MNGTRLSLTMFLAGLSAALFITAPIVAFIVNPIELPAYVSDTNLPWDPTHTAKKYLLLTALAIAGTYAAKRYQKHVASIALAPAVLVLLAVPVGATGYECVANRWSFVSWAVRSSDDIEELRRDRYVYLPDHDEGGMAVRIRPDVMAGLQWMRASGFNSDWGGLEEMEAEADVRRTIGIILLILAAALFAGGGFIIYREHATSKRGR